MTEGTLISERLHQALELAIELHGKDSRKGNGVPMLAHLLGVCALVQHDGGSEEEAIAALLHDALEDKGELITADEIERRFGTLVRAIVLVASDTPEDYRGGSKPPWKERKLAYLAHARGADPALLRVTIADKVDNLRATIADYQRIGELVWERFSTKNKADQLWYYNAAVEAYQAAGYRQGNLLGEMERLVGELKALAWVAENSPGGAPLPPS
jgi:GTP pyrophosphokinase